MLLRRESHSFLLPVILGEVGLGAGASLAGAPCPRITDVPLCVCALAHANTANPEAEGELGARGRARAGVAAPRHLVQTCAQSRQAQELKTGEFYMKYSNFILVFYSTSVYYILT